jgi:hypothetical protein
MGYTPGRHRPTGSFVAFARYARPVPIPQEAKSNGELRRPHSGEIGRLSRSAAAVAGPTRRAHPGVSGHLGLNVGFPGNSGA